MSARPIVLYPRKQTQSYDEAGVTVLKSVLPDTTPLPGAYEYTTTRSPSSYVPSLATFCIRKLVEYPDAASGLGGPRIRYEPPSKRQHFDLIRALAPSTFYPQDGSERLCLCNMDPRLWALLIQVFTNLPDVFRRFILPLGDKHLPLLQYIPSNSNFALVTVLELIKCNSLTDDTVSELRALQTLCALDASETPLTSHGVKRLAWGTSLNQQKKSALRILRLQGCQDIDDLVFTSLLMFPLLCVVDLRGTNCTREVNTGAFRPCPFRSLFHPSPIDQSLVDLNHNFPGIFSHENPFILHIDSLSHPPLGPRKQKRQPKAIAETYTFAPQQPRLPPNILLPPPMPPTTAAVNSDSRIKIPKFRNQDLELCLRYELDEEDQSSDYREFLSTMSNLLENNNSLTVGDLEEHLAAAAHEEARRESSLQAMHRFYAKAVSMVSNHECQYTKPAPRLDHRVSPLDQYLMLFKEPPLWTSVRKQVAAQSRSSNQFPNTPIASSDRSSKKARMATTAVVDMIAKRKEMLQVIRPRPVSAPRSGIPQRKNPFKKADGPARLTIKSSAVPAACGSATQAVVRDKPLRPISSLSVPSPPPPLATTKPNPKSIQKRDKVEKDKNPARQSTLPESFFTRSSRG